MRARFFDTLATSQQNRLHLPCFQGDHIPKDAAKNMQAQGQKFNPVTLN